MKIKISNECSDYNTYRAARVKSLFNVASGANFSLDADLPIDDPEWGIGLIVGPSGSGKTSIAREIAGDSGIIDLWTGWPKDAPIIDAISPEGDFDKVTGALSSVGLGSVPAWLRPFQVLSNGEQFRCGLARLVCDPPPLAVVDEFSSVVDRRVAQVGASAFAKSWRRSSGGQCVLVSCHYDIIDWLEPDWVFDTATGKYTGRGLWRKPEIELEIWRTNWSYWKMFEPHHYLKAGPMIAAEIFVGTIDDFPVCHCAISTRPGVKEWQMARIVVLPEWQGVGIGTSFINWVCERNMRGESRHKRPMPTFVNTSHPGLCHYFRKNPNWVQVSAVLHGIDKAKDREHARKRARRKGYVEGTGHGGHFRAIQGFRYLGEYSPRHKEAS